MESREHPFVLVVPEEHADAVEGAVAVDVLPDGRLQFLDARGAPTVSASVDECPTVLEQYVSVGSAAAGDEHGDGAYMKVANVGQVLRVSGARGGPDDGLSPVLAGVRHQQTAPPPNGLAPEEAAAVQSAFGELLHTIHEMNDHGFTVHVYEDVYTARGAFRETRMHEYHQRIDCNTSYASACTQRKHFAMLPPREEDAPRRARSRPDKLDVLSDNVHACSQEKVLENEKD